MDESAVEKYRHPWESDEHWDLRRTFILQYYDIFELDRLLCLSQVYFNVEILNCSYPSEVMIQIKKLAEGLPAAKRRKRKDEIPFVPEDSNKHYKVVRGDHREEKRNLEAKSQNRQTAASFFSCQK